MALANNCLDSSVVHQPCGGGPFGFDHQDQGDGNSSDQKTINNNLGIMIGSSNNNNISSSLSSATSSGNGGGFGFRVENSHSLHEDDGDHHHQNSLINFKSAGSGYDDDHHYHNDFMHHANASNLLSFDQQQNQRVINSHHHHQKDHDYSLWEGSSQWNHHHLNHNHQINPRLMEDFNCFDTASNYGFMINNSTSATTSNTTTTTISKNQNHGDQWLYSDATTVTDCVVDPGTQEDHIGSLKRPNSAERSQALKKQCSSGATNKNKPNKPNKSSVASKDPQSIAAKNRRERISERLKILQELVPNGSKVDLVTMLEKAISYVKFLQLQVKVLATDEFWPVQGGKAPDISQVKEAIDAILSSQRDRNSSSK